MQYTKDTLKYRNDVAGLCSRIIGVDQRAVPIFELVSPRACHLSDDVRALLYCREFVCTLLDLAKDQISDGESAAAYIVIVIAT